MKTWVRKSLKVGVLSAGIILVAGGAAQADWNTSDNDGVLTGNQVLADIDVPINVCGNAVGVLGDAEAACAVTGGSGGTESAGAWDTSGNDGIGTGNQVAVPVEVPINICGNAVGVLGDAEAACGIGGEGGGTGTGGYGTGANTESWTTGDNGGVLTGNQVLADVDVPINVCGNAISVAGDSAAACGISTSGGGGAESLGAWNTSGNDGVLTGNQVAAIIDVPINVCGNAVAVLGDAQAACSIGGEAPEQPGGEDPDGEDPDGEEPGEEPEQPGTGTGDGDYGYQARGGQAEALPIFGSVAGLHKLTQAVPSLESVSARDGGSGWTTGDNGGVLTGNQVLLDVDVPVNVVGNAVGVLGDAVAVGHIM